MDTGEQVSLNPQPLPPRTIGLTAVVAIAVSALLAAWGTFGDDGNSTGDYIFVSASWRSSRTSRSISQTRLRRLTRWPPGPASSA